jgi:hypothetical protein
MSIDVSGIKDGQRKMWTTGDYPDIARTLTGVAETILARAGSEFLTVKPGFSADSSTRPSAV